MEKYLLEDIDSTLHTTAEILKKSIQEKFTPIDFFFGDLETITPKNINVAILSREGKLLYKNHKDFKVSFQDDELKKIFNYKIILKTYKENRVIISPYKFYGKDHFLVVARDISKLKDTRNKIIIFFNIILTIIFFVFISSSNLAIKKVLKAIKNVGNVAQKIEKDNFEYRIKEKYNTKEIDEVIDIFNSMLDRVELSFNRIKQFTSDVSHELKTPITSIKNTIEVELIATRSPEEYKEAFIHILEEINWLVNIINDLLLMTRMESGVSILNIEPFNVKDMLLDVVELMEFFAEENEINIITSDINPIEYKGDLNKLKRASINLISNAIKYNKKGGYLKLSCFEDKNNVYIIFEDNGIGIKSENINKIFERFYRENTVRTTKKSGTGLGLSIVDFVIKMHKGFIEINSIEGKGSTFKITLPHNIENLI